MFVTWASWQWEVGYSAKTNHSGVFVFTRDCNSLCLQCNVFRDDLGEEIAAKFLSLLQKHHLNRRCGCICLWGCHQPAQFWGRTPQWVLTPESWWFIEPAAGGRMAGLSDQFYFLFSLANTLTCCFFFFVHTYSHDREMISQNHGAWAVRRREGFPVQFPLSTVTVSPWLWLTGREVWEG